MRPALLGTVAAIALLFGAQAEAKTPRDQLIIGMTLANVLQMDPHDTGSYEKSNIATQMYDKLLESDPKDESKLNPLLAESWSFADDGSITFKLREGAVFHSGNKVTAQDVVFSLQRPLLAQLNTGADFSENGFTPENVAQLITVVDDRTIKISKPSKMNLQIFLYSVLAQVSGSIVDSKLVQQHATNNDFGNAWLKTNDGGGGPFKLNRWNPNEILMMDRVDGHWGGTPKMRRIVLRHIPEAQAQRLQIERGDIDMAYTLGPADYAALDANPEIVVQKIVGDGFYHLGLNVNHPILGKPEVRKALAYLVPYDGLQQSVMTYFGTPWHRIVAKGKLGAYPEDLPVAFDPAKAKQMLADAGYPNGFDLEVMALSQPPFSSIATAFQEGAAAAGVRVKVTQGGGNVVYGQMRKRTFDIVVGRALGGKNGDPHGNVSGAIYNPDNGPNSPQQNYAWRTSFQDEKLNQMIEAAAAEGDPAKRAELYHEIQDRYEDLGPPFILVGQRIDPFAVRADVKGIVGSPSWTTRWDLATKD